MMDSNLTTAFQREQFKNRCANWLENQLDNAPLSQITAIESAMFHFQPRNRMESLYDERGTYHLFSGSR